MKKKIISISLVFVFLFLGTILSARAEEASSLSLEEEDTSFEQEIWDPLEPVNRGIFWFNDQAYVYVLRPVSVGYDYMLPQFAKTGVKNFFRHLMLPIDFVSNLLQGNFSGAGKSVGRFVINTTVGLLGTIDVAQDHGLPYQGQDLGLAFASWGIPFGPYIVLPLMGPSSLRDALGEGGESFISPLNYPIYYLNSFSSNDELYYTGGVYTLKTMDIINRRRDAIDAAKESSLDYYLFVQTSFYQYRTKAIKGKTDGHSAAEIK
ncbi:MAG: VacJ family lipoprotein [Deltaproteobacteria bacterium]|nr:VacJ family lipoprotein [Deltaproteobacteria bacterium]